MRRNGLAEICACQGVYFQKVYIRLYVARFGFMWRVKPFMWRDSFSLYLLDGKGKSHYINSMTNTLLSFGKGNAKLDKTIATFSLPSGFTCPGALECLSRANRETGKITDGAENRFRCFSASQEAVFPNVRKQRWHNLDLLRGKSRAEMVALIIASLPKLDIVRVHVAGDFFSQDYFNAWMIVASQLPEKHFYAYTKSVKFWIAAKEFVPSNFCLNASFGGLHDALIGEHNLKSAVVVFSEAEAAEKGLEIDHDDSKAMKGEKSFALLLHGSQPKGSVSAKALSTLKKTGWTGYTKEGRQKLETAVA